MVGVRRVSVVGTSGAGKTSLAREISRRLGIPYVELDAIHHQAGWTPMAEKEFRAAVAERIAQDAWVVDGNYHGKLGDLVWQRADTVIWLDLPRPLVMWQIVTRTVGRWVTGRELWNGNRERLRDMFSLDPEQSVIVWAWTTHARNRERYLRAEREPGYRHIEFIRVRSRRDIAVVLAGLTLRPGDAG
ncbi:AAA family ATPase [Nocardia sp. NPDC127526]|uniref:AAA family ATPase n=1 Tax=Nocardia sp. NPDC127526 TaxID=3345393 RepID=UPI003624FB86